MRARNIASIAVALSVFALVAPISAQEPNPTCHRCQATYIPKSELDAYAKRGIENKIVDQQVRSVDVGKLQVGIGMVTRGKLVPGSASVAETVAEHDQVSEVYYIIDGAATLLTGPDLVDAAKRPDTLVTVKEQNGPGFSAASIKNPETHELKAGDMIIIPAGTGHWFTKIDDHITYAMVRLDPDKVVPLKSEAQSLAHLKKPYVAGQGEFLRKTTGNSRGRFEAEGGPAVTLAACGRWMPACGKPQAESCDARPVPLSSVG